MNFIKEINLFENVKSDKDYITKIGDIPILFVAAHTINHIKEDGSIKLAEPYTKAIALYLNKYCNTSFFIKTKDTGEDSNKDNNDEFKKELINFVKTNNIKIVVDLHGANKNRDFDIEFGTLNNLTTDFSTIRELEDAFVENNIKNISYNNPFKGGAITQYLYGINDLEVIQLEINGRYRNHKKIENLKLVCDALISFIEQYIRYTNR